MIEHRVGHLERIEEPLDHHPVHQGADRDGGLLRIVGSRVAAGIEERVDFLCEDYAALLDVPDQFKALLACLVDLHGRQTIARWHEMIDARAKADLFRELIERHYDPAYRRSSHGLFRRLPQATPFAFQPNAPDLAAQARRLLAVSG